MKLGWLWLIALGACSRAWQVRTLPPCYQALAEGAQERERAELAAQVALQNRGFVVQRRDGWIDAESARLRWRLRVANDGALEVDAPGAAESAETRARFGELQQSVAKVRCRELEELRAEAQTRRSAGGEVPARLVELHRELDRHRLGGPISVVALGAAFAGAGLSLANYALIWRAGGCEDDDHGGRDCSLRDAARPTGIAAAALIAAGGVTVGLGVPWMIRTIRTRSALNREIRQLRQGQLTMGAGSVGWRLRF